MTKSCNMIGPMQWAKLLCGQSKTLPSYNSTISITKWDGHVRPCIVQGTDVCRVSLVTTPQES